MFAFFFFQWVFSSAVGRCVGDSNILPWQHHIPLVWVRGQKERVYAMEVIHRYTYIDHYEESDSDDSRMVHTGSSKMQIKLFCMTTFKHKATSKSFCTHLIKLLRHSVIQMTDADQWLLFQ